MNGDIATILEYALRAPSGDNAQPWRVAVEGEHLIQLFNRPERDTSLYNWGNRAAYVAHGAFIENAVLAAQAKGYAALVRLFPEGPASNHVAAIALAKNAPEQNPLHVAIAFRSTNRKPYEATALSEETVAQLEDMVRAPAGIAPAEIMTIHDRGKIQQVAEAVAKNEQVLFGNREMHRFFFSHINWTDREDHERGMGFHVDTLELPPPARALFPLWRRWPVMRIFNAIGFPKMVAKENTKLYVAAGCVAAITIPSHEPGHYIAAGRALERLWLAATHLGLQCQPLTGIAFLHARVKGGNPGSLTPAQSKTVEEAYARIAQAFSVSGRQVALLARIGKGPAPTSRTSRITLAQLLTAS